MAGVPGLEFAHKLGNLLSESLCFRGSSPEEPSHPGHRRFLVLMLNCTFKAATCAPRTRSHQSPACPGPTSATSQHPSSPLARGLGCILAHHSHHPCPPPPAPTPVLGPGLPPSPTPVLGPGPHPSPHPTPVLGPGPTSGLHRLSHSSFPVHVRTLVFSLTSAPCPTPQEDMSPGEVDLGALVVTPGKVEFLPVPWSQGREQCSFESCKAQSSRDGELVVYPLLLPSVLGVSPGPRSTLGSSIAPQSQSL